jgi:trimeric autotransporter adhesin
MTSPMKISGYLRVLAAVALGAFALLGSENHGTVTLGGLPVPGVIVTATQGERKVTAMTDGMGTYSFPDLVDGTWTVQVEMSGFTTLKQDVTVGPDAAASKFELKIKPLSDIQAQVQATQLTEQRSTPAADANTARPLPPSAAKPKPQAQAAAGGRGGAPVPAGQAAATVAETPAADESSQRAADGYLVNGSQVNGGASPFALNPAFGNNRRGPRSLYTYQLSFANVSDSITDAKNFSQNGAAVEKPAYFDYTINATVQGPLRIPHVLRNGPTFGINWFMTRARNDNVITGLMPTEAERTGDLSALAGSLPQFPGNIIPQGDISPQATALLALFPKPTSNNPSINYQTAAVSQTHSDGFNSRLQKAIGRKTQLTGTFALTSTRSTTPNAAGFPFLDTNSILGMNLTPVIRRQWTPRMSTVLTLRFNRNANHAYSFFENTTNVSGNAGILGNYQNSVYWGPPTLNFGASGFQSLSDGYPSFNRTTTYQPMLDNTWNHGRHNVTFGGDVQMQDLNYYSNPSARGTFSFTGAASGATGTQVGPFADFLLGIPDTSTLAYGNADKYLRAKIYELYVQDDWRVNSSLTLNLNLRYEYNAPVSELYGRLVNLDVAQEYTAIAPVLGSDPKGSVSGLSYPSSLVRPERLPLEPSIGLAWRPISGSSLVVRAGYALRFVNPGYVGIAANMDQQAPLSASVNGANGPSSPLTLANGFIGTPQFSPDSFAIDPNFRESYAQNWTASIQKDLPGGMQMVATYQGIKGTRMPQYFYPNSYLVGTPSPCEGLSSLCTSGFTYETSNGDSTREAGSFQLRRRLHAGFTASVLYTYAKAIDDTNTKGQPAQNWLNLSAERGLSSFDQRQQLTFPQLQYTSGMGLGGGSLISGWKAAVLKEWTLFATPTWGTGLPETPLYTGQLGGTTNPSILRPNFTGASLYAAPAGMFLNQAAFAIPAAGEFGNAGVDTITGPQQFSMNGAAQRTFRINDRTTLNLSVNATNVLNHVVFSGWGSTINSQYFGVPNPNSANTMRRMTIRADFRF